MKTHAIQRGLDIPIAGAPEGAPVDLPVPNVVGIDPREIRGLIPRLAAREGDSVKRGEPILYHKFDHDLYVPAPVSGTVKEVRRGRRRVIEAFVIEPDGKDEVVEHRRWSMSDLSGISAEDAVSELKARGGLPLLRTRPVDHLPDASERPSHVLIAGTETGPAQAGPSALLSGDDAEALQAAVHVLGAISQGKVYLTVPGSGAPAPLQGLSGVDTHAFSGPHPSGDPAVQVSYLCPPGPGDKVWYLTAWDAAVLGRLFLDGVFDSRRVYGVAGVGVTQPRFVRSVLGAPVAHLAGETREGPLRWIRGSVLTGATVGAEGFGGWFSRTIHVLPDEVERTLMGWANPANGMWSFHKAFLKAFSGASAVDMRPGLYGGHRAIVPTGMHDQVVATPHIHPVFLFRSLIAGDLEGSIDLGMLDISMEEAALMSFICPAKIDYDVVLRDTLDLYAKEA